MMKIIRDIKQKYSANLRLWHWLNSLVIIGSLLTILINSTLFDKRSNTAFITKELENAGASVTAQQARAVSHGLEEKIWDLHVYLGYFLVALFVYRLVFEIFQPKNQKFKLKLQKAFQLYRTSKDQTNSKDLLIKLIYLVFYFVLFLMVITGLTVKFHDALGIGNSLSHSIKEVHGFLMYVVLAFIVLHIVGVVQHLHGAREAAGGGDGRNAQAEEAPNCWRPGRPHDGHGGVRIISVREVHAPRQVLANRISSRIVRALRHKQGGKEGTAQAAHGCRWPEKHNVRTRA
ncbi:MAG: cytochrome b/b6 domain-containing protein [Flavobacteriales bacterium]|nr:MAG: cytochrome b/b6 domain-containing protein [Flavobacteriales bacterium]